MKFAVISDIHGNLPALDAVMADVEKENVDTYIFVGDYCISHPYPDECIAKIRSLDKKYAVRGNEEQYLENLIGKDRSDWTDGQMQISYWCYQKIKPDNLRYLLSLPAEIELIDNGVWLHIAHSSEAFIGKCEYRDWSTAGVAARYKDEWIMQEALEADIRDYFNHHEQFQEVFSRLENGIYIFGHSHVQWSYQSGDGKKILLNPGSCGLPLDCIKEGVPYTILAVTEEGNVVIEERRAAFDKEKYITLFRQSEQFQKAAVWSNIIVKELETTREHMRFFLNYVENYAGKIGDTKRPYSVSTWEKAFELWQELP